MRQEHWNTVYTTKQSHEVSWFQAEPRQSLELIAEVAPTPDARIIDVGGGDARLVDCLLQRGYANVTVLDVSGAALARTRARIGENAAGVEWLEADIVTAHLPADAFDVWHDRAVFHFLIEPAERAAYVANLRAALRSGGSVIMATFAPDGPQRCSGLPVARYSGSELQRELGGDFALIREFKHSHTTPAGPEQRFTYALLRRR